MCFVKNSETVGSSVESSKRILHRTTSATRVPKGVGAAALERVKSRPVRGG